MGGMQQNGLAESQGFSILQIVKNNWYLILHFPPTQQTGWSQSVLRMLLLALVACKITPQNAELDASLHFYIFYSDVNWDFLFPVDIVPSTAPSCWAPHHNLPFATLATSQGHPRLLGQARMFRTLCGQMAFWNTHFFVKYVEKRPFWAVKFGWNHPGIGKSCGSRTAWDLQEMGEGQRM